MKIGIDLNILKGEFMVKGSSVIIGVSLFFTSIFSAQIFADDSVKDYFTLGKVEIKVRDLTPKGASAQVPAAGVSGEDIADSTFDLQSALDDAIMVVDKLIALGDKVWKIVESGRPVVNLEHIPSVSVLPLPDAHSTFSFYEMEGWKAPKVKELTIIFKNLLGAEAVKLNFVVAFQYGGSYQGKGEYLTGVNIYPGTVSVGWGYSLDSAAFLDSITNRGTKDWPVAGATFGVNYTVKTVFKQHTATYKFHVTGKGELQVLNTGR